MATQVPRAEAEDAERHGPLPNYVIVGAPKSGTSSLARWLMDHPEAYLVPEKELHFFSHSWELGLDWYRTRFAAGAGAKAIGEASPSYLADDAAHERMASAIPGAKLIALLRNPVDRTYSHYWHWFDRKGERRSFEQVVADELAAPDVTSTRWDEDHPRAYSYLESGRYLRHVESLCRQFPREHVLVMLFEDLTEHSTDSFQQVCRFLGIDDTVVPPVVGSTENAYRYYYPRWLWSLLVRVQIGRWIPGRAAGAIYRAMVRTADPYPPMDAAVRARLVEHFEPYNAALSEWLGRDLSHWSR